MSHLVMSWLRKLAPILNLNSALPVLLSKNLPCLLEQMVTSPGPPLPTLCVRFYWHLPSLPSRHSEVVENPSTSWREMRVDTMDRFHVCNQTLNTWQIFKLLTLIFSNLSMAAGILQLWTNEPPMESMILPHLVTYFNNLLLSSKSPMTPLLVSRPTEITSCTFVML